MNGNSIPATDPDATVLILGAAGAAGIGAIAALRQSNPRRRIVAVDRSPYAAGFTLCDAHTVTGYLNEQHELAGLRNWMKQQSVSVILPTAASDTRALAQQKEVLARDGVIFFGCDTAVLDLCDDKLAFHHFAAAGFPLPRLIGFRGGYPEEYPCFVKPRKGAGGNGVRLCLGDADWCAMQAVETEVIAQEVLPGAEYSVDVLSDTAARPLMAVVRLRMSTSGGISTLVAIRKLPLVEKMCLDLALALGISGPSCMQLKEDAQGVLKFQEVNPRFGGGAAMSAAAGADIYSAAVAVALGERFTMPLYKEIIVARYWREVVFEPSPQ